MYLTKKIFVFRYYYYTYDDLDKRHALGGYLQTQHYQSHLNDEQQQKQQQEGSEDWGYGTGARDVLQTCLNVYLFFPFSFIPLSDVFRRVHHHSQPPDFYILKAIQCILV